MFRIHCALAFAVAVPAFASSVVYVDNSRPAGGDGTAAAPFATIGAAGRSAVIYVEETATPYAENVSLVKGQKLIGSAYGLDALRAEAAIDANVPAAPARQGAGPVIRGTINLAGDNIVAGCTVIADRSAGITSSDGDGIVSLRSVFFQTSHHGFAIYMLRHHGAVSITGGGIQAMDEGSGITLIGGDGDVMIERFPLTGSFHSAVRVSDRDFGAVTFRNGTSIGTDSATDDAVVVANMAVGAPVTFSDRIHIRGSRRGFVAAKVFKLVVNGGDSWLSTTGAAALDLRDVGADVVFVAVSSEAAPEGLVADKVRGKFQITGRESEPGSGGTIRAAKNYGARIVQSSGVRLANMTLIGSGSKAAAKGARCSGDFDTTSVVPCNAALYLRHLEGGSFENIVIDGGGQIGLNASNIRRVTFENLDIHGAGD
ncbi:MAG: hypothetical protein ACXVJT_11515, partial [Thermoanaerobaculia bacterium]